MEIIKSTAITKMKMQNEITVLTIEKVAHKSRINSLKESLEIMSTKSEDAELAHCSFDSKFYKEFHVNEILEGYFSDRNNSVFRAKNLIDCEEYAVKRIAVHGSDSSDSTLRDVRLMAQLDHPGIVRFYGTWMEQPPHEWQRKLDEKIAMSLTPSSSTFSKMNYSDYGHFMYIQMQLCSNSLERWLNDNSKQQSRNLARIKSWFKQIVTALEYIHEMNLIHRDLKPSNVLFVDEDRVKLCDIGIVNDQFEDNSFGSTNTRRNRSWKNMYKSPEQISSTCNSKCDIFSLGLILAELCVVMTKEEAANIFDNYRAGIPTNVLEKLPEVKEVVEWLTCVNGIDRPDCQQILEHSLLHPIGTTHNENTTSPDVPIEERIQRIMKKRKPTDDIPSVLVEKRSFESNEVGKFYDNDEHAEDFTLKQLELLHDRGNIIGRGQYAESVRRCVFKPRGLPIAVKIIHIIDLPNRNYEFRSVEKIKEAIENLRRFAHDNIITFHGFVVKDMTCYICMELMQANVDEVMKVAHDTSGLNIGRKFSNDEIENFIGCITVAVVDVLAFFGQFTGYRFPGVNPPNIMINANGQVKISSFTITKSNDFLGCIRYMAPEQFSRDAELDRLDGIVRKSEESREKERLKPSVWSLGIMLYTIGIGKHPYEEMNSFFIPDHIAERDPPRIARDAGLSSNLRNFVDACLFKETLYRASVEPSDNKCLQKKKFYRHHLERGAENRKKNVTEVLELVTPHLPTLRQNLNR